MKKEMNSTKVKAIKLYARTSDILVGSRGESYVGTVVVISISVVLGASLPAGLCVSFGDVVFFS